MNRFLKIAAVAGAAAIAGFGWYAFSPLLFDDVVEEQLVAADQTLSTGEFVDADAFHQGSGTAQIVQMADGGLQVQLSNFEVTNGPDLKVYISSHPNPTSASDVTGAEILNLGELKGNVGDQAYDLPEGVDLASLGSVVIWCEQFGVLFATAALS